MTQSQRLLALALSLVPALALPAQDGQRLTLDLYLQRAAALRQQLPPCQWIPGAHDLALVQQNGDQESMLRLHPEGGDSQPICDARAALQAIGKPAPAKGKAAFPAWSWVDATTLRLATADAIYYWHPGEEQAQRVLPLPLQGADRARTAIAPDDQHLAFVRDEDLVVAGRDGAQRRITWDGSEDIVYGGGAHREEFGIQGGLFWSPTGNRLAFYREDQRPIALYPYQDPTAMPPHAVHGRYPMAGRADSIVQVGVYDVASRSLRWLENDPTQDLYWTNVTFSPDGSSVYVALVNRGQDHLDLARFDATTGARLGTVLQEDNPHWIEPEHGPRFLADGRFLWWSSRDGHRHLYLHDTDGRQLLQITRGTFDVQELLGFNADQTALWFHASGEDPRMRHLFAAKLDGSDIKQLTRDRGTHHCALSPDGSYALDTWSNFETPASQQFVDLAGGAAPPAAIPAPPNPLAKVQLPSQRAFQVKADDGTVLYGHLLLPADLDETKRYPVLLYVYGGPHAQLVTDSYLGGAPLWLAALANDGYIVCRLDNRGTPNRGIEFEQAIHRQLGTVEVQDQLKGVDWLVQQSFVDPARIGVHGWSFGGYMTLRLMLLAPERFACGVAGAPVTDWAMYETGYTERYMDTPAENPDGYKGSSCLPLAGKLKGRLLLVQGTDDKTVMWAHSLQFVDRSVDAGVLLDYFPYPMQVHGLVGRDRVHFMRLLKDHLDRYLHPGT